MGSLRTALYLMNALGLRVVAFREQSRLDSVFQYHKLLWGHLSLPNPSGKGTRNTTAESNNEAAHFGAGLSLVCISSPNAWISWARPKGERGQ